MTRRYAPAVLIALLAAAPARSAEGWTFSVSPYAWFTGVSASTRIADRTLEADVSAGDVLSNLDFAFMGAVEARNGPWGLILDTLYADIGASRDTPFGELWSEGKLQTKLSATTVYAGYRVVENEKASVDLLAGGRFYSLDLDARLTPGSREEVSRDVGDDWADPVVGLRGRYAFAEKWYTVGLADAGGFSDAAQSWQLFASVGYQFNPSWSVEGGWRYLDIEREINGQDVTVDLNGPIIGVSFHF